MGIGPVDITNAKIQKIAHVPLKKDQEGHVVGDTEVDITLRVPHSLYVSNTVRLNNAWARQADVSGTLDFVEQTQLFEQSRRDVELNGHDAGADKAAGKLTKVEPIGGKKKRDKTPA